MSFVQERPLMILVVLFYVYRMWQRFQPMKEVEGSKVVSVKSAEAWRALLKENALVIVDFYATWCPPCKAAAPVFAGMSKEEAYSGVVFAKVNVDELRDVAREAGISAMPTFKLYSSGKEANSRQGWSASVVRTMIDEAIKKK